MKNKKNNKPQHDDAMSDYNPTNRDFQRVEEDTDDISKSEKEELESKKVKQRMHKASTMPDKNHIG